MAVIAEAQGQGWQEVMSERPRSCGLRKTIELYSKRKWKPSDGVRVRECDVVWFTL